MFWTSTPESFSRTQFHTSGRISTEFSGRYTQKRIILIYGSTGQAGCQKLSERLFLWDSQAGIIKVCFTSSILVICFIMPKTRILLLKKLFMTMGSFLPQPVLIFRAGPLWMSLILMQDGLPEWNGDVMKIQAG